MRGTGRMAGLVSVRSPDRFGTGNPQLVQFPSICSSHWFCLPNEMPVFDTLLDMSLRTKS